MLDKLQEIKLPINPQGVLEVDEYLSSELVIVMNEGEIRKLFENWRQTDLNFHQSTLFALDEGDRIDLYYFVVDRDTMQRVMLIERLDREKPKTRSRSDLTGSLFYEGEAAEMYGIVFEGNPVNQVFLPEDWGEKGFPMRKDWTDPKKEESK